MVNDLFNGNVETAKLFYKMNKKSNCIDGISALPKSSLTSHSSHVINSDDRSIPSSRTSSIHSHINDIQQHRFLEDDEHKSFENDMNRLFRKLSNTRNDLERRDARHRTNSNPNKSRLQDINRKHTILSVAPSTSKN